MAAPVPVLALGALVERLRESTAAALTVGLLVGLPAGLLLGGLEGPSLVAAEVDRQFTIMTTLLSAIMTVIGVVLSIMVVAQQLASQQYSPRAIRTTLRDRSTRLALAGLFGYVGFMLGVIQVMGPELESPVGVPVGMVLSVAALGVVAFLIQHVPDGFRAERLLARIAEDTLAAISRIADRDADAAATPHRLDDVPDSAEPVYAPVSGYLQDVDMDGLTAALAQQRAVLRLHLPMGSYAGKGTCIGWAWPSGGVGAGEQTLASATTHLRFGPTQTTQREIGSDVQQMADIALKALSPGINDPFTAVQAINALTRVLQALAERRQDWLVGVADGEPRLTVPRPLLWDFVARVIDQVRLVAGRSPQVLIAMVTLLRTVAAERPDEADRIDGHLDALLTQADTDLLLERDLAQIKAAVDAARQAKGAEGATRPREDGQQPDS